jgi:hypothetical protein
MAPAGSIGDAARLAESPLAVGAELAGVKNGKWTLTMLELGPDAHEQALPRA